MYGKIIKRIFDFILALCASICLFPLFILLTIFLSVSNRGSAFFTQKRPGKGARIFTLIKFRTMNNKHDSRGNLLPDSERLTKVGKFIRSTSLDEIPQLINVLKGDMSLIGPRPLLIKYLPRYTENQSRRHEVRPGITGWAQINGRNAISWEKKFELDLFYVENLSLKLDCEILIKTIQKVIYRKGITAVGEATISEFKGIK